MNSKTGDLTPTVRTRGQLLQQVAAWKRAGERVGFVPTMGALHGGHLSLIEKAKENATRIVASIFVNPTQFAPGEDFDTYPRDEDADLAKLASVGCDLAYLPTVGEMYPDGSVTNVRVEEMSDLLDGIYRPHFFYGVATVVARLFLHVQPDVAVFGEKDYQQLRVVRRGVADLDLKTEIVACPTVREDDGLAMSSRNLRLGTEAREVSPVIGRVLESAANVISQGGNVAQALETARQALLVAGFDAVDYFELRDDHDLQPLMSADRPGRLFVAAWLDGVRLIDNTPVKAVFNAPIDRRKIPEPA